MKKLVTIIPPHPDNPTIAELKAYKRAHGVGLREAMTALGWKHGTRVVPYTGTVRVVDGRVTS